MYQLQGWGEPSPEEICYLLTLKKNTLEAYGGEGFYYLAPWPQERKLFEESLISPQLQDTVLLDRGIV